MTISTNAGIGKDLTPLQRALIAVKDMRAKVETMERVQNEPIAIVGMACRFPGIAGDLEGFWRLLDNGESAVREIPPDRWDINTYYDPDPEAPGKHYVREGGFMESIDTFDAGFFGITPREAVNLDPQQRLLLEVSWEALEDAGIIPASLQNTLTGVFVGIGSSEYLQRLSLNSNPDRIDAYVGTGNTASVAAGRVSFFMGLRGPAIAMDTACSSSLVALDMAVQHLRTGKCRVALAGGVNVMASPETAIYLCKVRALSPDGRCKTFDVTADGYGRGEGCGMIALKRLSDAQTEGDRILAVILGSAVNHDGHSSGLTVPNGISQQEVIRAALANARIQPSDVDYIEAHGTGTVLGDPIEMGALHAIFGPARSADRKLIVGTVKTNIGHLEAAAGIAGVIKVVLAMQHGRIPRHLNLKNPSPHIPWGKLPVMIPTESMSWPARIDGGIAGVSSFGFSGTNAHVVLRAAPKGEASKPGTERPVQLLPLSATNTAALKALADRHRQALSSSACPPIGDVCHTAGMGRSDFSHRLAVVAEDSEELAERLSFFGRGEADPGLKQGIVSEGDRRPKVAFLFTGQGSQYVGMGRQLYDTQPGFRATLDLCDALLRPYLNRSLVALLYPASGMEAEHEALLGQTHVTQPALFALEYALATLWRSWGIEPSAVMGHSVGEYVAACVSGLFNLEDGLKLIAERGRLMQALPASGRMAAVFADPGMVAHVLGPYERTVSIAAFNGPENTVISGVGADVEEIVERFAAEGIDAQMLAVSHAFHSPLMEPMLDAFERVADQVDYQTPRIKLISNLTGTAVDTGAMSKAGWWRRHVREPVRFAESVESLRGHGCDLYLEVGPHPTLLGMAARCLPEGTGAWLPSLRRGRGDWQQMLDSLAELYVRGARVDWQGFDRDYGHRRVPIPTYPFQRKRYWISEPKHRGSFRGGAADERPTDDHRLLGKRLLSPVIEDVVFESAISADALNLIRDHVIFGLVVFPGTGYLQMALAAGRAALGRSDLSVEDVAIEAPMVFSSGEERKIQLIISPADEQNRSKLQIFSTGSNQNDTQPRWTRHVSGAIRPLTTEKTNGLWEDTVDLNALRKRIVEERDGKAHYGMLRKLGIDYGVAFQTLEKAWLGTGEALGRLVLSGQISTDDSQALPLLLDGALQVIGAASSNGTNGSESTEVYLPISVDRFHLRGRLTRRCWVYTRMRGRADRDVDTISADLRMYADDGGVLAELEGFVAKKADSRALRQGRETPLRDWLYKVRWQRRDRELVDLASISRAKGSWLIFADAQGVADELIHQLEECGNRCIAIYPETVPASCEHTGRSVNPVGQEDFQRLFDEVFGDADWPLQGIAHFWSLGIASDDYTIASLEKDQELGCGSILHLIKAMGQKTMDPSFRLWLVTAGAQAVGDARAGVSPGQAPVWGLGRVIASEHPELRCTIVDLDPVDQSGSLNQFLDEIHAGDRENQIMFRGKARYVARLVRHSPLGEGDDGRFALPRGEAYGLRITKRGSIENLELTTIPRPSPGPGQVEIQVRATGLNFRDVLNVLGMYPGDPGPLGGECVGRISALGEGVRELAVGDEVLAIAGGSFAKYVVTRADWVMPKPEGLSHAQAATIPITFLTACYGLFHLAKMKAGDRVLIHAAAGGVGMAAVQLAQWVGAEVFGTAGSAEKRAYLKSLGVDHVMNSRTLDFADEIKRITEGRGVDIVLNALTGDFIPRSLASLAPGGRFIEIGKADVWSQDRVARVNPTATYMAFDLAEVIVRRPSLVRDMFNRLFPALLKGRLKPLPYRVFPLESAISAFRFMAQARHIGKIVVLQEEGTDASIRLLNPAATYLVTGGLGGLGLVVTRWLVTQGARHIVLMGRSAPGAEARTCLQELKEAGAEIMVYQGDVTRAEDLNAVFDQIGACKAPLRGIIHAAGVLDDGVLLHQDWNRFSRVLAPKVKGSWLLHSLCRDLPLDFFVMFSSTASLLGAPGQGNYAAANAFMDGLAHLRRAAGLTALSIGWGPWSGTGMAASSQNHNQRRLVDWGFNPIRPEQGLDTLGSLLGNPAAHVAVMPVQWNKLLGLYRSSQVPPMLDEIAHEAQPELKTMSRADGDAALNRRLKRAPEFERREILSAFVSAEVARVMGLDPSHSLDLMAPFASLGLDSLMAVELRNVIAAATGKRFPPSLVYDYPSIEKLSNYLIREIFDADESPPVPKPRTILPKPSSQDRLSALESLSDEEVERLFSEKRIG